MNFRQRCGLAITIMGWVATMTFRLSYPPLWWEIVFQVFLNVFWLAGLFLFLSPTAEEKLADEQKAKEEAQKEDVDTTP